MLVLDALEDETLGQISDCGPRAELTDDLAPPAACGRGARAACGRKDADLAATVRRLVVDAAVPHLAAQRLTEKGLRKREVWEQAWELQRAEDRGEDVERDPASRRSTRRPTSESGVYWKHRGKLDVPKERFVLIPNAERGADTSPVVGWAGWDERDLARALAGRIMELREQEAADADRLAPLLAGVLELLPWIHQWHPEATRCMAARPAQFFEGWLDGQLAALGVTRDTLRAWRPPTPTRGRKAKASTT